MGYSFKWRKQEKELVFNGFFLYFFFSRQSAGEEISQNVWQLRCVQMKIRNLMVYF